MNNITALQSWLKNNNLDVFILYRTDEFLSEYMASYAERLKWISNFSGSAGKAVIMQTSATIFVDGRYTLQAKKEVNSNFFLIEHFNSFSKWLKTNLDNNLIIGLDPYLHSKKDVDLIQNIAEQVNAKIKFLDVNPIDELWKNQPPKPSSKAFFHGLQYSGKSIEKKNITNTKYFKT